MIPEMADHQMCTQSITVRSAVSNEKHARRPGIRRAARFFGPLAVLALLSQVIATLVAPAGISYPDSFCYLV